VTIFALKCVTAIIGAIVVIVVTVICFFYKTADGTDTFDHIMGTGCAADIADTILVFPVMCIGVNRHFLGKGYAAVRALPQLHAGIETISFGS